MQENLQQAIETGKITQDIAAKLEGLQPGGFCRHKSWGFGRIAEWSLLTGKLFIDFPGRKNHPMQIEYAVETLQSIFPEHTLARKILEPEAVRAQAAQDPVGLTRAILTENGGTATVEEISQSLCPEVFDAAGFKKWWNVAKKKLKADGHFRLPEKKADPIALLTERQTPGQGLLEKFRGARLIKDQVSAVDAILRSLNDLAEEAHELDALTSQLGEAAKKGRRLQPAQTLELLLARDEILAHHQSLTLAPEAPRAVDILSAERERLADLFAKLPAAKQREALALFPEAFGESWPARAVALARKAPARLAAEVARVLEQNGHAASLESSLTRWITDRSVSSEILLWLSKERGGIFPKLFNADLLNALLNALEQDLLSEKRGSRLHDLLLDDKSLLGDLLQAAAPDEIRDAMRRLLLTPAYDDLDKRSLLGRFVKLHPELESMISGDEAQEETADATLTVSWPSLEARKVAYERLINVEIPQNTRDISMAREQGDLRENFGFKAAKEQQRVLMRRRAEAERELSHARGTNFENPDTTQVSIGTTVTLETTEGTHEVYSILGAWDSIVEKGIVSYLAGLGQALLGKKPGEPAVLPSDTGTRSVTILKIEPFTNLEILRPSN